MFDEHGNLLADSHALIKALDALYPHRCPSPREDTTQMWMYAGKRELIDSLMAHVKQEDDHVWSN